MDPKPPPIGSWHTSTIQIQVGKLLQQGKRVTKVHIQKTFPHLPREIDTMGTISS
jgi:hypothetical protein